MNNDVNRYGMSKKHVKNRKKEKLLRFNDDQPMVELTYELNYRNKHDHRIPHSIHEESNRLKR